MLVKNELRDINSSIINVSKSLVRFLVCFAKPCFNFQLTLRFIFQELNAPIEPLKSITQYYFDSKGKLFRPMVILLMAKVCKGHLYHRQER